MDATSSSSRPRLFSAMHFSGEWRDYQARVLGEMDGFLDDNRLHIVAAPGSGKTILGLEAVRRIGRPALALSPSLTIRNQWRERLVPLFMPKLEAHAKYISRDIADPAEMTIATYQSLHASYLRDSDYAALRALGPITLVLDECHHLRREWWNALFALREALDDPVIVALTATPPYDSGHAEWSRYERLCGPIDAEIGVPALVRNGDLAPHQDYVHFSQPSDDIVSSLMQRREAVFSLFDEVVGDAALPGLVLSHPFIAEPFQHEEAILEAPEQLSAMLFYLASRQVLLPQEPIILLGVNPEDVPDFNHFWLEAMLECLLHRKIGHWRMEEERAKRWQAMLSEAGLITNHKVDFSESIELARLLAGSTGKLRSIVEIAQSEDDSLGNRLCMAVLTDHVRAAELPRKPDAPYAPKRLGVVPIFETLRRADIGQPIGVLTGSLVIVPQSARAACCAAADALDIPQVDLSFIPLAGAPDYLKLEFSNAADRGRVALITKLVEAGDIRILVGTQALLGEGWDAPSVNSLVLASNAASYMLSNQMRGRAIRIDPEHPEKVANIWHLATVDPVSLEGQGPDFDRLIRRFSMFDGVAAGGRPLIENGIERLSIDFDAPVSKRNARTLDSARNRSATKQQWLASLGAGTTRAQVREVAEVSGGVGSATLHVRKTLKASTFASLGAGFLAAGLSLRGLGEMDAIIAVGGGAALIYSVPGLFTSARLWLRNGTLERRLRQVGETLLEALAASGNLSRGRAAYKIRVQEGLKGRHAVTMEGGTRADQHRFVTAMLELLGPVENPRYILRRDGEALGFRQLDYHAVPMVLGRRKQDAEIFHKIWMKRIGTARLIFCRSKNGRRVLLRARSKSLAAGLRSPVERRSMWL